MRRSGNRGAIPPAVSPGCQGKRPSQTQPDHPETNPGSHRAAAIDSPGEVFRAIAQNAERLPELRVGGYCIVLRLEGDAILVLGICHWKDVYEKMEWRLQ